MLVSPCRVDSVLFFFFKQKTAYEFLTGDWSSDVCSSDLNERSPEDEAAGRGREVCGATSGGEAAAGSSGGARGGGVSGGSAAWRAPQPQPKRARLTPGTEERRVEQDWRSGWTPRG